MHPPIPSPEDIETTPVGRLVGLWRYPVKSMAGEALETCAVGWHGLAGDRRWAFVRPDSERSGFPWFTLRERADLNHYRPRFADPEKPDRSATVVRTPTGAELDVADPALGLELCAEGARVIKQSRGVFDTFPLSLISTQTLASLSTSLGLDLGADRFRPNLLVDTGSEEPFPEDAWVGRTVRIGDLRMRVDQRDGRCLVVTIDPATGERSPQVLREIAQARDGCLGVYGSTVTPGRVRVGDAVAVEPAS